MDRYNNYKTHKRINYNINDIKRWGFQIGLLDDKENSKFMSDIDALENLQLEARKREHKCFNKNMDSEIISNLFETSSAMSIMDRYKVLKDKIIEPVKRERSVDRSCDNTLKQSESDCHSTRNKRDSVDKRWLNGTTHQEFVESYTKELTTSKENPDFNCAESQNELIKQNEEKDYPSLMRVGISESCPIPRPEEAITAKIVRDQKCLQNRGIIAILRKRARLREMLRLKKEGKCKQEDKRLKIEESSSSRDNCSLSENNEVGNKASKLENATKRSDISSVKKIFNVVRPKSSSSSGCDKESYSSGKSEELPLKKIARCNHARRKTETFTIGNSHMKNKREIKLERYLLQNIDDANSQRTTEKHFEAIKEQIMKQGDVEAILK